MDRTRAQTRLARMADRDPNETRRKGKGAVREPNGAKLKRQKGSFHAGGGPWHPAMGSQLSAPFSGRCSSLSTGATPTRLRRIAVSSASLNW